ncbi:hypothetical protein PMIN06_001329 [Paraphaeosphaeria minitans]
MLLMMHVFSPSPLFDIKLHTHPQTTPLAPDEHIPLAPPLGIDQFSFPDAKALVRATPTGTRPFHFGLCMCLCLCLCLRLFIPTTPLPNEHILPLPLRRPQPHKRQPPHLKLRQIEHLKPQHEIRAPLPHPFPISLPIPLSFQQPPHHPPPPRIRKHSKRLLDIVNRDPHRGGGAACSRYLIRMRGQQGGFVGFS